MAAPTTLLLAFFLFFAGLHIQEKQAPPCGREMAMKDSVRKDHFPLNKLFSKEVKPMEKCIFPIREIKQDSILWQRYS